MKKILLFVAIAAIMTATSCGSSKQVASQSQRPMYEKDGARQVADDFKERGYKPYGGNSSMFTLYELVSRSRNKVLESPERYIPVQGVGEHSEISSAQMFALGNASNKYATQAGSVVTGKMTTQFSNLTPESRTKIAGAYEQKVSKYIMPVLTEDYLLVKNIDTQYRVIANYMIDENNAKEVRKSAIDEALRELAKEIALEQSFLESVSKLVEEQPYK